MPKSAASPVVTIGRIFYALALLGFGIEYAVVGHLRFDLILFPHWLPFNQPLAYAFAAILVLSGLALVAAWRTVPVSLTLGLILLTVTALYFQKSNWVLHTADGRTNCLETLCFASAALILHGLATNKLSLMPGRIFFAFAMIVFGAQHFMYTRFINTLIPAWIPQHTFVTYFTGVAFIAAGLSIATTIADKAAAFGLFIMFFSWLVILYIPAIAHALHSEDQWANGFMVLGLSGASLLVAASSDHTH